MVIHEKHGFSLDFAKYKNLIIMNTCKYLNNTLLWCTFTTINTVINAVLSCISNLSVAATAVTFQIFPQNLSFLSCCLVCAELSQTHTPKTERAGLVTSMQLYTSKQQQQAFNNNWDWWPCNQRVSHRHQYFARLEFATLYDNHMCRLAGIHSPFISC